MKLGHKDFIQNKYYNWYLALMIKAKERNWYGGISINTARNNKIYNDLYVGIYTERHHILPRSMKGKHNKKNTVFLTAREHYIAHLLLTKCTKNKSYYSMLNAMIAFTTLKNRRNLKLTSKSYEKTKKAYLQWKSDVQKGKPNNFNKPEVMAKCHKTRRENNTNPFITNNPMYNDESIRKKVEKCSGKNHYYKTRNRYYYNVLGSDKWIEILYQESTLQKAVESLGWKYSAVNKLLRTGKYGTRGSVKNIRIKREYIK